jgi:hypothetical protein
MTEYPIAGLYVGIQVSLKRGTDGFFGPVLPDGTPCRDDEKEGTRYFWPKYLSGSTLPVTVCKKMVSSSDIPQNKFGKAGLHERDLEEKIREFIQWAATHKLMIKDPVDIIPLPD